MQPGFAFDSASTGDEISWPSGDGGSGPYVMGGDGGDEQNFPSGNGGLGPYVVSKFDYTALGVDTGVVFRMRGFDTTLAVHVYWNLIEVDADGSEYSGPGPLTNIVVSNILFI